MVIQSVALTGPSLETSAQLEVKLCHFALMQLFKERNSYYSLRFSYSNLLPKQKLFHFMKKQVAFVWQWEL